jgi:hypothetical protein
VTSLRDDIRAKLRGLVARNPDMLTVKGEMPAKEDAAVTFELEDLGLLEIAWILHPIVVTFRVSKASRYSRARILDYRGGEQFTLGAPENGRYDQDATASRRCQ